MEIERCGSPEAFLSATERYRGNDPIRTNVLGSVAMTMARQEPSPAERYWWVAHDEGTVVGAAMRTAPWVLSLGPMPTEAAVALATDVATQDPMLPGVAGFLDPVDTFLAALGALVDVPPVSSSQHQLLYEIEQLTVPAVAGACTVATPDEVDAVEACFAAFSAEVDGHHAVARSDEDRRMVAATIGDGRIRWWSVDGEQVSLAGHATPVETPTGTVTRVGPVYTPPEYRRHGYAGAVTGALSEELLDRGSRVMLYTDAANATSNKVYRELGYELVDEFVRHSFSGRSHR